MSIKTPISFTHRPAAHGEARQEPFVRPATDRGAAEPRGLEDAFTPGNTERHAGRTKSAEAALKALALEVKGKAQKNRGAAAATLGGQLMAALQSSSGRRAMAALGLGASALGMMQSSSAALAHITQTANREQRPEAAEASTEPASAWLRETARRAALPKPAHRRSPQAALIEARRAANQAGAATSSSAAQPGHALQQHTHAALPDLVLTAAEARAHNASEITFTVPAHLREVKDGQRVLVPLEAGRTLHMVEVTYQDTRRLRDLEFNRTGTDGGWETFRGDELRATEAKERAGELAIRREPDHNSPWINNPIRVRIEVVDAEGKVLHRVGRKLVDFHVHDARSADSSGYPETDNINNTYDDLPKGALADGAYLRLTAQHENRKAWEQDRAVALELSWVKPIYMPAHSARVAVRRGGFEAPKAAGYDVEPGRPLAGVFVTWTDHGGTSSGRVRLTQPDGTAYRSSSYNVGSGETELIPLDGVVSKDGKLHIEGAGLEVGDIEVLYQ